jgi:hypothetical protein
VFLDKRVNRRVVSTHLATLVASGKIEIVTSHTDVPLVCRTIDALTDEPAKLATAVFTTS